ncbi:unnamed protein product [Closterium sp. Yama58-4]|nr:unnamed protein product [Closterium sp. Yama58-4]
MLELIRDSRVCVDSEGVRGHWRHVERCQGLLLSRCLKKCLVCLTHLEACGALEACGEVSGPAAITVSEEVPAGVLGEAMQTFSITGLYVTFVLALGRLIRSQSSDLRLKIPYENLPSCERLMAICEDLYAARAEGDLELEEGLYWTLIKIYRSPHVLLEYTKGDKAD